MLAGGVIALFIPLVVTSSLPVLAQNTGNDIIILTSIDPCNMGGTRGPCLKNLGQNSQDFQGLASAVFGVLNSFIVFGSALSVAVMFFGAGMILFGKDKEGRLAVRYAAVALGLLIATYIVFSLILGLGRLVRNIVVGS